MSCYKRVMLKYKMPGLARYILAVFATLILLSTSEAKNMISVMDNKQNGVGEKPTSLITMLGDSLTAGLNVPVEKSYPALVEEKLIKRGFSVKVRNAGVSGDTTSGGLRRLDSILSDKPDIVVLELGVNDGLRGIALDLIESNLERIIKKLKSRKITVVLAGMKLPPNYGSFYGNGFEDIFSRLASKYRLTFIPFLLEGVAGNPRLNQFDGIHPTGEGYEIVSETVLSELVKILQK